VPAATSVLIVEDDTVIAWHLESMLKRLGHFVCGTVSTERAAIDQAAELQPDLILMDVRLADGGDGVRAAASIRASRRVGIVFCTAHADDPALRERIATFDLAAVLGKPIWEDELGEAIESVTGGA
jgi:CheY-like chemotaxis protein